MVKLIKNLNLINKESFFIKITLKSFKTSYNNNCSCIFFNIG